MTRIQLVSPILVSCTMIGLGGCTEPTGTSDEPSQIESRMLDLEFNRFTGPVRSGYIIGSDGKPVQIRYADVNGIGYYQGDIDLGPVHLIPTTLADINISQGVTIDGSQYRWSTNHVPYVIDASIQNPGEILAGLALIAQTTNVTFGGYSGQLDYVRFVADNVCSSRVGRGGGGQIIRIDESRCFRGSVAHEMLHTLGMYHEMQRCDRNTYVEIQYQNIPENLEHNFDRKCTGATDRYGYEERSVMHYGQSAGCGNPCNVTILSLRGLGGVMGQRDSLALTDRQTINTLYPAELGGYISGPEWAYMTEQNTWQVFPSGGTGSYTYGDWRFRCDGHDSQSLGYIGSSVTLVPAQLGCEWGGFTLDILAWSGPHQGTYSLRVNLY